MSLLNRITNKSARIKNSAFVPETISFETPSPPIKSHSPVREVYHISDGGEFRQNAHHAQRVANNQVWADDLHLQRCCWHEVLSLPLLQQDSITIHIQVHKLVIDGLKSHNPLKPKKKPLHFQRNFPIPADVVVKSVKTTWLDPQHLQVFGMKKKYCEKNKNVMPEVITRDGSRKRLDSYTAVESDGDEETEKYGRHGWNSAYHADTYYKTIHFTTNHTDDVPYTINRAANTVTFTLKNDSSFEMKTVVLPKTIDGSSIEIAHMDKSKVCITAFFMGNDRAEGEGEPLRDDITYQARRVSIQSTLLMASMDFDTSESSGEEDTDDVDISTRENNTTNKKQLDSNTDCRTRGICMGPLGESLTKHEHISHSLTLAPNKFASTNSGNVATLGFENITQYKDVAQNREEEERENSSRGQIQASADNIQSEISGIITRGQIQATEDNIQPEISVNSTRGQIQTTEDNIQKLLTTQIDREESKEAAARTNTTWSVSQRDRDPASLLHTKETQDVIDSTNDKLVKQFLHTAPLHSEELNDPRREDKGTTTGKSFHVCIDVSGYLPHEITVKVARSTVVVAGYHEESEGSEGIEYQFKRRLNLQAHGADPDSLKVLYEDGDKILRLCAALKC